MKALKPWMIGAAALCAAATLALADDSLPGKVDFGAFSPPKEGGEFVEVNVPTGVIKLAAQIVEKQQPDVADILHGLQSVRVNVIGLDDENRPEVQKRAEKIRKELSGNGWERLVTAQEKDQDVSVYLKMDDKGAIQGVTAVVLDGKDEAVFVNVVGSIKPDQLAMLGDKLHIDPLKKLGFLNNKSDSDSKGDAKDKDSDQDGAKDKDKDKDKGSDKGDQ